MTNIEIQRAFEPDVSAPKFSPEIATVAAVMSKGLTLIFDGTSVSDGKVYPCNAGVTFMVGDRVKLTKVNGTYVVECPIGVPGSRGGGGGGGVTDVKLAGTSIVSGGVANITIGGGLTVTSERAIKVNPAGTAHIDARTEVNRPIAPSQLDYAVKAAMCDGKGAAWSAAEQAAARARIGVTAAPGAVGSNPNLLDNAWFTINQRGWTTGSGTVFTVDRWRNSSTNLTTTVNADSSITCTATAGPVTLRQTLINSIPSGTVLTLSAIIKGNGNVRLSNSSSADMSTSLRVDSADEQLFSLTFTTTQENTFFEFKFAAGESLTFRAAKLEYGMVSTLALDHAPDYATELSKCLWCYERIAADSNNATISTGFAFSADSAYFPLRISPKRSKPSLSGASNLRAGTNSYSISGVSASIYFFSKDTGMLTLEVKKTGAFVAGNSYRLGIVANSSLEFTTNI